MESERKIVPVSRFILFSLQKKMSMKSDFIETHSVFTQLSRPDINLFGIFIRVPLRLNFAGNIYSL